MTLRTYSLFYYGFNVGLDNQHLDFSEGGSTLSATIAVGSHTATEFARALKVALDSAGANTYTVGFSRTTRKITISANGPFQLRISTGPHAGSQLWTLMGFTGGADLTGASTYTGPSTAGDYWAPQFWLQSYVGSEDFQQAVDATVNKTASGRVEVVKFGVEKFIEFNASFITDIEMPAGHPIRNSQTAVADARRFLQFATTKAPFEIMVDDTTPGLFETVLLESTPESQNGVGYRLKELYDRGLPQYFETGRLRLRVLE